MRFVTNKFLINQTAAAAAGAIPRLMQLADDGALQRAAVKALGRVVEYHGDNQAAAVAAGAIPAMTQG